MHRCTQNNRTISPLPLIWSLLLYSGAKIQKMKMTSISYVVTTWVTIYENSLISESVATLPILLCTGLTKLRQMRNFHNSKKKASMCHIPFMYNTLSLLTVNSRSLVCIEDSTILCPHAAETYLIYSITHFWCIPITGLWLNMPRTEC